MDFSEPEPPAPDIVRADPVERLLAGPTETGAAERTRLAIFFVAFLACHMVLLALVLSYAGQDLPQPEQEIPVEIVQDEAQPPPPQPPEPPPQQEPKKDAQKQPPPDIDMTPAQDKPRTANEETVDRQAPDKQTSSPQKAPASDPGTPSKNAETPSNARATLAPTPGPVAMRQVDERLDAEALEHAEKTPDQAERSASPEPKPQTGSAVPTMAQMMARLEPIPDYKIAGRARPTPVSGGTAKDNYLAILHGMITPHLREPSGTRMRTQGSIVIYISTTGGILHVGILQPSGSPDFDVAALDAVRRAAPFPTPPAGLPPVIFTYCQGDRCSGPR